MFDLWKRFLIGKAPKKLNRSLKSEFIFVAALESVREHNHFPGSGKTCRIVLGLPVGKIERAIQVFKLPLSLHHNSFLGLTVHCIPFKRSCVACLTACPRCFRT